MPKLSFALPQYDGALTQLFRNVQEGLAAQDELLGQIQTHSVSHGGTTRQVSEPQIVDTEMHNSKAMFEMSTDAFLQTDTKQFTDSLFNLIESFHREQKKYMFEVISQTTEAVGNAIDAKGRNIWDVYVEMIETTQMTFDAEGNHNYQIVMHPETAKKLRANPPTPEQSKRIQEAIEAKRREYYERKPTRRLSK
jgi:hypothetical protein